MMRWRQDLKGRRPVQSIYTCLIISTGRAGQGFPKYTRQGEVGEEEGELVHRRRELRMQMKDGTAMAPSGRLWHVAFESMWGDLWQCGSTIRSSLGPGEYLGLGTRSSFPLASLTFVPNKLQQVVPVQAFTISSPHSGVARESCAEVNRDRRPWRKDWRAGVLSLCSPWYPPHQRAMKHLSSISFQLGVARRPELAPAGPQRAAASPQRSLLLLDRLTVTNATHLLISAL